MWNFNILIGVLDAIELMLNIHNYAQKSFQEIVLTQIKTIKWLISGRVQSVGFRFFTYRTAKQLEVKGTVKNLEDGRVEIIAQADETNLEKFYQRIKKGPRFSLVTHIEIVKPASTQMKFDAFTIDHQ